MTIPKKFHYVFIGDIHEKIKEVMDFMIENNPDFEFKIWREKEVENYIKSKSELWYKYYKRINPKIIASKVDFFRYILMYYEGGIYMDVKCKFTKPIEECFDLNLDYILIKRVWSGRPYEFINGILISKVNNPMFLKVIEEALKRIDNYEYYHKKYRMRGRVWYITGPQLYTNTIENNEKILEKLNVYINTNSREINWIFAAVKNYKTLYKEKHYMKQSNEVRLILN